MRNSRSHTFAIGIALLCGVLGASHGQDKKSWLVPEGRKQVIVQDIGKDETRRVILENGFFRAVVNPSHGGRIESFIHKKSGKEMTSPLAETIPGGLLSDQVWQQNFWHSDWNRSPYAVKIVEQTPDVVRVELTSPPGKLWTGISFQKTLSVWRDRSVLQADYSISANANVTNRCRPDLHFHQGLAGEGKVFLPSESGVIERPIGNEAESWVYDPARGWAAFVQDTGTGLGAAFDGRRIKSFRTSQSPSTTMEWILRKVEFKSGTVEKTPVQLAVFTGLKEVTVVGERLAADLNVGVPSGGKVDVHLAFAPFQNFKCKVTLTLRPMTGGEAVNVLERNMSFDVDTPAELNVPVKLAGDGNWILSAVVRAEGMADLNFDKPVFAPTGKGTYALVPDADRIPEVPDAPTWARFHPIDFNFNSTAIPTPHRKWAKKWAGGRPRVLALLPEGSERQAVEMMQRFDMDITCAYLCDNTYYVLGDSVRGLKLETVKANLDKTVQQDFDVITMNMGDTWSLITTNARNRILEMVKNGAGLVLFQRGAPMEEWKEYLPLDFIGYDHATGFYTLVTNSPPVLAAMPYAAMPMSFYSNGSRMRMRPDSTNTPMGTILLKAVLPGSYPERGPLVAIGQIGKGRLVQAQIEGELVPPYGKFVSVHMPEIKPPNYDYWEYHYAMVARMIYWAAHKESPVSLTDVQPTVSDVKITLDSQIAGPSTIELVLRDKFGEVLEKKTQPIDLKSGNGQTFTLPVSPMFQGACFIGDVFVSNAKGVLAFGGGAFPVSDVRFTKLAPEKTIFLKTESATLIATITNAIPQGAVVRGQLFDGSGRQLAQVETPAVAETKLSLPLDRVIGPVYEVRATLVANGRVLDQTSCEARIKATRDYESYKACFWGGVGGGMPENIIEANFRLYQSMGMNAEFGGEGPLFHDIKFLQRLNMPYSTSALGMYTTGGVTKEQTLTNKVEHGNVLTSPTAPETYRTNAAARGLKWKDDDVLQYSCGDENRGSAKDIDFSEDGKRSLRAWVQEKYYKSIDDLNKEWGTQYKSWDEVIPMTEAEAKEHLKTAKSCGAWLDQRLFLNWSAARLAKSITDGVRSTDPTALVGESGSQEPYVYGTDRDWWYMSKSYTALAAYGGEQTVQNENYNPTLIRYKWAGYGKPNPLNRAGFYNIMGQYDRGIAVFAARSHIDPDFTLPECGRDVRGSLIELERGIGQALVSAKMQRDPVFILHSSSSMYGAHMLGLAPFHTASRATAMHLLEDLGLEYQYISYEQVSTGELKKANCRVLLLPAIIALGPEQVAAIREWVKDGGTLIADMKTGLMTEHGRLYDKPQLDDVFGIDRTNADPTDTDPDSPWTGNDANGQPVLHLKTVERGITGKATPLGQVTGPRGTVPIVFHNAFGKGHAYYLAADVFGAYTALGKFDDATVAKYQFIQSLFDKAIGEAGVQPQITVQLRDAKTGQLKGRSPWIWTSFKQSGKTRYYIVIRNYFVIETAMPDVPATIQFGEPGVIYDVVDGKKLGRGDSVDTMLVNGTCRVFAVLPSEVTAVEVAAPTTSAKPGDDVSIPCEVKVAEGTADPRVLRVEVTTPKGEPHRVYTTNLICPNGKGTAKIPFALNDERGDWGVRVTDVASGMSKAVKVSLK